MRARLPSVCVAVPPGASRQCVGATPVARRGLSFEARPGRLPRPRRRSPHRASRSRSPGPAALYLSSTSSSRLHCPLDTAGDALFSSPSSSAVRCRKRARRGSRQGRSVARPVPLPRRYVHRGYLGWWISLAPGRVVRGAYGRGSSHGRRRWRRPCGRERPRRGERLVWTRPHRGGVLDLAPLLLVPHRRARRRHPHRLWLVQALQLQVKLKTFLNPGF